MSAGAGSSSASSKAASNQPAAVPHPPASNPALDSASQRRVSTASSGATSSSRNLSSPRNNQSKKNNHKRHRRPNLVDEDAFAEVAAMKSTTSRKGQTSITHLMNFSLPPRPQHHHHHRPLHRGVRRNPTWGVRSGYHVVDKARYVHANYRFIVNPQYGYHAQATNADVHLDWDKVLQVLVSSDTQETSCPICLSTPVAPRMARCGHVFCLPCLIRYMHSTDDEHPVPAKKPRSKKCPICWDNIYVSETRPVGWYRGQNSIMPMEGGDIVLRLVMRHPGSTLALPREGVESVAADDDIPWYHVAEVPDYARIMKGGEDYISSQYDAEIQDLQKQEHEDELLFGDDTTWIRKAMSAVKEAKEKISGIGNPPAPSRQPVERRPERAPITFEEPAEGVPGMYAHAHAVKSGRSSSGGLITPVNAESTSSGIPLDPKDSASGNETAISSAISKLQIDGSQGAYTEQHNRGTHRGRDGERSNDTSNAPHPPNQPFYFYQALPHFYLSPLDIRILKTAFGDYSQFPSTILPRIERISTGHIVDDELRKRTKYLGHLPFGCEVNFLECDWTDLVSQDVLNKFDGEICRRRKKNKEKAVREEKERLRAEKSEEEKRWSAARRKRSSVSSIDRPFSDSDFQPLGLEGPSASELVNTMDTSLSSASPPWSSSRGRNRPSFTALGSPSGSPPGSRTVWGTTAIAPTSPQPAHQEPPAAVEDGWLQDWEQDLLAEQQHELLSRAGAESSNTSSKKKKNKKITLMSTTGRRAA